MCSLCDLWESKEAGPFPDGRKELRSSGGKPKHMGVWQRLLSTILSLTMDGACILGFKDCHQKINTNLIGLKQERFIPSQFWRPEGWSQKISHPHVPFKPLGDNLSFWVDITFNPLIPPKILFWLLFWPPYHFLQRSQSNLLLKNVN